MNPELMQKQLAAITQLTLANVNLIASVCESHMALVEQVKPLLPDDERLIAFLSRLEQTQAGLAALRNASSNLEQSLRGAGMI